VRQLDGTSTQPATNAAGVRNNGSRIPCSNPAFAIRAANTLRTIPFRLGNLRFPARPTFDMSLNKSFAFTENVRAQIRLETFNTFNTPIFNNLDSGNATSNTFGVLNPNGGIRNQTRQVQLGFKLNF
jgi:hypothetical protein